MEIAAIAEIERRDVGVTLVPLLRQHFAENAADPFRKARLESAGIGKRFRQFRLFERLAGEGNASNLTRSKRKTSEGSFSVRPFDAGRYDGPTRTGD